MRALTLASLCLAVGCQSPALSPCQAREKSVAAAGPSRVVNPPYTFSLARRPGEWVFVDYVSDVLSRISRVPDDGGVRLDDHEVNGTPQLLSFGGRTLIRDQGGIRTLTPDLRPGELVVEGPDFTLVTSTTSLAWRAGSKVMVWAGEGEPVAALELPAGEFPAGLAVDGPNVCQLVQTTEYEGAVRARCRIGDRDRVVELPVRGRWGLAADHLAALRGSRLAWISLGTEEVWETDVEAEAHRKDARVSRANSISTDGCGLLVSTANGLHYLNESNTAFPGTPVWAAEIVDGFLTTLGNDGAVARALP